MCPFFYSLVVTRKCGVLLIIAKYLIFNKQYGRFVFKKTYICTQL